MLPVLFNYQESTGGGKLKVALRWRTTATLSTIEIKVRRFGIICEIKPRRIAEAEEHFNWSRSRFYTVTMEKIGKAQSM